MGSALIKAENVRLTTSVQSLSAESERLRTENEWLRVQPGQRTDQLAAAADKNGRI